MSIDYPKIMLATISGLLGTITPNLRKASVSCLDRTIYLRFYFDAEPNEIEKTLTQKVASEVISHFPESYHIEVIVHVVAYPQKIQMEGFPAYSRYEKTFT